MPDYDELTCPNCGWIGLEPNGGYSVECPACGYECTLDEIDGNYENRVNIDLIEEDM